MAANREKVIFSNKEGIQLAGLLEKPDGDTYGYVLFAHCFTCGKDIAAATRIGRALAEKGYATLRFDFTGLGNSDGDFANTNFSSNVDDLIAAADFLREHYAAPDLLIGHSLGGAAVLSAAGHIDECKAVATIGAPSDPSHVSHQFSCEIDTIRDEGVAEVSLAGRPFTIKKQFLDDIESNKLKHDIENLNTALLVFHSPADTTVSITEAASIYASAKHPKSFVSLDKADHLLTKKEDAEYVAATITAWVTRYLEPAHTQ
ncbi:MAG: alpha/beta hydrolase family protein [Cellvibrionaceae bacterium]